jgi:hypothetical protein
VDKPEYSVSIQQKKELAKQAVDVIDQAYWEEPVDEGDKTSDLLARLDTGGGLANNLKNIRDNLRRNAEKMRGERGNCYVRRFEKMTELNNSVEIAPRSPHDAIVLMML